MTATGNPSGNRLTAVAKALVRRPWLLLVWVLLASLVVWAQGAVPQPWSAAAYPLALIVATSLFRLSGRTGGSGPS